MLFDVEYENNAESNYLFVHSRVHMEPRDLLTALMTRDGDNPNSLSVKLKGRIKQPQIYKFITGAAREPRRSTLQPLAEHYDIPIEAFYDAAVAATVAKRLRLDDLSFAPVHADETMPGEQLSLSEDLVIREYATGGSMGRGALLRDQPGMIHSWHVTPEWIQKNIPNCTNIHNLAIVTGFGDSMRGLYNPGDPLIVDTGVNAVEFDAIYFFRVGEEGFIKRLQRVPGEGLIAISENKAYRDWVIKDGMDFEVFARVIKVWRSESF